MVKQPEYKMNQMGSLKYSMYVKDQSFCLSSDLDSGCSSITNSFAYVCHRDFFEIIDGL